MSIVSQFYGIIVRIHFKDSEQHYLQHIYVQYNEYDAVYLIKDCILLEGELPPKQHKLLVAWMEIHKEELFALWNVAQNDGEIFKIDLLK